MLALRKVFKYLHQAEKNQDSTNPNIPSLTDFPLHILVDIASRTDKATIWSMMATSRGVRVAAEVALRPYLRILRNTVDPPYFPSVYKAPDLALFSDDETRHKNLRTQNTQLSSHLAAYPPARHLIRELIIEVRDDDAESGWPLVKDVAEQLESLELQIQDRFREQTGDDRGPDYEWWNPDREWFARWEHVPDILDHWSILLGDSTRFSNLLHLVLKVTSRGKHHYRQIAPYVPNLLSLRWTCFWEGETRHWVDESTYTGLADNAVNHFRKLEVLCISAPAIAIRFVAKKLLDNAPNVRHLTLNRGLSDPRVYQYFSEEISGIVAAVTQRKCIESLALYGQDLPLIFIAQIEGQVGVPSPEGLGLVSSLVFEESLSVRGGEYGYKGVYPLLSEWRPHEVLFPALEYFTWVLREDDPADPAGFYDDVALQLFFTLHPYLRQIQWLTGYPSNPSIVVTVENWDELKVRCCVCRPSTTDDPLRPIYAKEQFRTRLEGDD